MSFGFHTNNITLENITNIVNMTSGDPTEFFIRANNQIYGGWFFFIILLVLGFIIFRALQQKEDNALGNLLAMSFILSIGAIFLRLISIAINGVLQGLITDWQMWLFPLFTAIMAFANKYAEDS